MTPNQSSPPGISIGASHSGSAAARILLFLERHFVGLLSVIFLLALALRVIALFAIKETPYFNFLMMDERIYHDWGKQIADGSYMPRAAYEFPPLPAYITAFIYWLFSPNPLYTRVLNVFLGSLTCVIIGLTAKQLDRPASGLLAALTGALYKPLIFYSAVPLKTALSVFLCAAVVYLLASFCSRATRYKCALMGVLIGLALNVRGNYLVLAPVAALAILWTCRKSRYPLRWSATALFLYAAGLLAATAPFAIRNHNITGEWVLTTTQAGFNFYLGNNLQNPTPYSQPVAFAASSPVLQGVQFTIEASRRTGHPLTASEASWFWTHEVFREAAQQPRAFAQKLLYKILAPINRYENCDHYDLGFLSRFIPFLLLPFPAFTLVWPFGLAGMFMEWVKFRRAGWLAAAFCAYLLTLIIFFSNGRYRLPLLTILIPFAALAVSRFLTALLQLRMRMVASYLLVFAVALGLSFFPIPGSSDLSRYYNFHGIVLESSGDLPEAMRFWQQSADLHGGSSAFANYMLASRHFKQKDYPQAAVYLERIPDESYAAFIKYSLLGDLYSIQYRSSDAVAAYKRSVAINSGQIDVRQKLFRLLERLDPDEADREEAAIQQLKRYYKGL